MVKVLSSVQFIQVKVYRSIIPGETSQDTHCIGLEGNFGSVEGKSATCSGRLGRIGLYTDSSIGKVLIVS